MKLNEYVELLIQQYRDKPKARQTIALWCGELDAVIDSATKVLEQIDIDKAQGFSLDIIGRRVGVVRLLPAYVSKGFFGYVQTQDAKGWGKGKWFKKGDSTGESINLSDDDMRFLIKARILKNFQDGSLDYTTSAIKKLFSSDSYIVDNLDMTARLFIPMASLSELQVYLIKRLDILPRPMGVKYDFSNLSLKGFGFDGFKYSNGFNDGSFVDA